MATSSPVTRINKLFSVVSRMNNWYFLSMENDFFLAGLAAFAMIGLALGAWRTAKKRAFSEPTNSPRPAAAASSPGQGIPLFIQYAEANGEVNSLRIDVLKVEEVQSEGTRRPRLLLFGWCHQRRARIEFAVARIESLTDPRTGEVYDRKSAIAGYLRLVAPQRRRIARPKVIAKLKGPSAFAN